MDKPFNTRLGFTRQHQLHNSGPEGDPNRVRPYGPRGVLVTGSGAGILVVAAVVLIVLMRVPPARSFFLAALGIGAIVGFVLWLRHR
jgi:hypothetical protein